MERKDKRLKLVKQDPWLEPVEESMNDRYNRYIYRLQEIENNYGSLEQFANAHYSLGVHYDKKQNTIIYREWAPAAYQIYLFGDFNDWNRTEHPLHKKENGIWEIQLDAATYSPDDLHKTEFKVLVHADNGWKERIPAYITRVIQHESTNNFNAQFWFPEEFDWQGDAFNINTIKTPLIYEAHVGMAQEEERIGKFREFADNMLPYIKSCGYNIIQLMAIAEHPYYGSFGYHVSNFFAPSSRFGEPEDLKYLIREAHKKGLAVIMDIIHSHTVKNLNEGINEFDGTDYQYFQPGERGNHPTWDSKIFDYGKTEVQQFLLSNLKYWIEEFHFDGFRFDGVTSMMYFHRGLTTFDKREKYFTEGVEFDAITYLQLANTLIHKLYPEAYTIAEDVSGMPGLTFPPEDGGIGFNYRLGMGIPDFWIKLLKENRDEEWDIHYMWQVMNDRVPGVGTVAYAESHDQAMVGDKTISFRLMDQDMYYHMQVGDDNPIIERGIALHKMIRLFTLALGGTSYLNFMGNEFGHPEWIDFPREGNGWSYKYARRQWSLVTDYNLKYYYLGAFDKDMLAVIKNNRVFKHEFAEQINQDTNNQVIIFKRNNLVFVFNFSPAKAIPDYDFVISSPGKYNIILNSDNIKYGGFDRVDETLNHFTLQGNDGQHHLKIYIPNRTVLVLRKTE